MQFKPAATVNWQLIPSGCCHRKDFSQEEMAGWQWNQLQLMQIICTSLQTDTVTMPASHQSIFYRSDALPNAQPTVLKHGTVNQV